MVSNRRMHFYAQVGPWGEKHTHTMTYHDLATTPGRSRLFPTHLAKSSPAPTGQTRLGDQGPTRKWWSWWTKTMEIRIKKVYTSLVFWFMVLGLWRFARRLKTFVNPRYIVMVFPCGIIPFCLVFFFRLFSEIWKSEWTVTNGGCHHVTRRRQQTWWSLCCFRQEIWAEKNPLSKGRGRRGNNFKAKEIAVGEILPFWPDQICMYIYICI